MVESCDSRLVGHNSAKGKNLLRRLRLRKEMELYMGWRIRDEQIYYATCHSFINHSCRLCFARAACKTVIKRLGIAWHGHLALIVEV